MFLKVTKQKSGRVSLAFVEGYRDDKTQKTKHKVVENLGYLDQYTDLYEDPIAHFKEVAKETTLLQKQEEKLRVYNLGSISLDEEMDLDEDALKHFGFLPLSYIYHQLRMREFWINRQKNFNLSYSLNDIMQLLVYLRILSPGSKRSAFKEKETLPFNINCEEHDIYRALDIFDKYKEDFLLHLHEEVRLNYGRKTDYVFYDVTNYYFEIDREDEFRKKGFCKHNTRNPLVQMGLLLDNHALPITYELFEGNTHDSQTMMPILQEVRRKYGIKRLITVADKALNPGDNVAFLMAKGDGFIFSQKVKGGGEELENYVFDRTGYKIISDQSSKEKEDCEENRFMYKSRPYPQKFWVTHANNKKKQIPIDVKLIICYSDKYAKRQKYNRQEAIEKAMGLINNPSRLKSKEDKGALRYIANIEIDSNTGECIETGKIPFLNLEKIKEDAKYDGFYAIITSEFDVPDLEIIEQYHNLWEIEHSFRITKDELKSRPVHVSLEEHIRAHFLTCFIALLILRLLCRLLDNKFPMEQVIESLRKSKVCFIKDNLYRNTYFDEVLSKIQEKTGLLLNRKYFPKGEIRTIIAKTKKH